jgi:hypothetical protein
MAQATPCLRHKDEDMSDYNEQTLMEAVIKRVAAMPDPRLRQIMTSLVKHLHGCVREVRPTWEELLAGIQFLTAVRPVSYGIPTDGPVGAMLQATKRHNMRSAHLHFMISAPGHERLVTQLFLKGDQYLDSDVCLR